MRTNHYVNTSNKMRRSTNDPSNPIGHHPLGLIKTSTRTSTLVSFSFLVSPLKVAPAPIPLTRDPFEGAPLEYVPVWETQIVLIRRYRGSSVLFWGFRFVKGAPV